MKIERWENGGQRTVREAKNELRVKAERVLGDECRYQVLSGSKSRRPAFISFFAIL